MVSLRICHMIPGFFPIAKGGAEVFALNLCKGLALNGVKAQILTRNLDLSKDDIVEGLEVHRFPNILPYKIKYYGFGRFLKSKFIRTFVAVLDILGAIPAFLKIHKKKKFHLLHASFILPSGFIGLILRKIVKIPVIVTVHGPADFYEVPKFFNPILKFTLKRVDMAVAVSRKLHRDLNSRLGSLKIIVVPNGVSMNLFSNTKSSESFHKYGINPDDFIILTAGRLVKRKNLRILIQTYPEIRKRIPKSKLILLGSGIEQEKLVKLIKDLNLSSSIIMPGWISEEEKRKIFNRADIFIQLSQVEGLSLALLESKAAGIPAIIVGSKKLLDPVTHRITGLLINPPLTQDKIVEQVIILYQDKDLCHKIGRNVRIEAEQYYSLQKMVEIYYRLYLRVLNKYR